MHHFVVKFSKKNSPQAVRGIDPLIKILRTPLRVSYLRLGCLSCAFSITYLLKQVNRRKRLFQASFFWGGSQNLQSPKRLPNFVLYVIFFSVGTGLNYKYITETLFDGQ